MGASITREHIIYVDLHDARRANSRIELYVDHMSLCLQYRIVSSTAVYGDRRDRIESKS
jgi:hypothetical protein